MHIPKDVQDRIGQLWIGGKIIGFVVEKGRDERWVLMIRYTSDVRPERPDELWEVETTVLESDDPHWLAELRRQLEAEYLGLD